MIKLKSSGGEHNAANLQINPADILVQGTRNTVNNCISVGLIFDRSHTEAGVTECGRPGNTCPIDHKKSTPK